MKRGRPPKVKAADAEWHPALLDDADVKTGIEVCRRYGIDLDGSSFAKAAREVRRLDHRLYVHGGGASLDRSSIEGARIRLAELSSRRATFDSRGIPVGEIDESIASVKEQIATLEARIEAAGDCTDAQPQRRGAMETASRAEHEARAEVARYASGRQPIPADVDEGLDMAILASEEAARRFEAGRAELERLSAELREAETAARAGLASVLRLRVLPLVAGPAREAMVGKVDLFRRRPDRPLPEGVDAALREGATICGVADHLAGEGTGVAYLVKALADPALAEMLFPPVPLHVPPRRSGAPAIDMGARY